MTNESQEILSRNASTVSAKDLPVHSKEEYLALPGSHLLTIRRHSIPVLTVTPSALTREDIKNNAMTAAAQNQNPDYNDEKTVHIQRPIQVKDDFFSKARRYSDRETNGNREKTAENKEKQCSEVTKTRVFSSAKEHANDVTAHEDNGLHDDDSQSRKQVTQTAAESDLSQHLRNTDENVSKDVNANSDGLKTSSSPREMASTAAKTAGDGEAADDKRTDEDIVRSASSGDRCFSVTVCTPGEVNGDSLVIVSENGLKPRRKTVTFDQDEEDDESGLVMRKTPYNSDISDDENPNDRPDSASTVGTNVDETEVDNRHTHAAQGEVTDEEPSTSLPSTPSHGSILDTSVEVQTPEPTFQVPSLDIQTPSPEPVQDRVETKVETTNNVPGSSRTVSISDSCHTATTAVPSDTSLVSDKTSSVRDGDRHASSASPTPSPVQQDAGVGEMVQCSDDGVADNISGDYMTNREDSISPKSAVSPASTSTLVNSGFTRSPNPPSASVDHDPQHSRAHSPDSGGDGDVDDARSTKAGSSTTDFEQEARVNAESAAYDEDDEDEGTDASRDTYSDSSDFEDTRSDVTLDAIPADSDSHSNEKPQMSKSLHTPGKSRTGIEFRYRTGRKPGKAAVAISKKSTGTKINENRRTVRKPTVATRSNIAVSKLGMPNKSKSLPQRGPRGQATKGNPGVRPWAPAGTATSTPTTGHLHPAGGRLPDRLTPLLAEERLRMTPSPRHSSLKTHGSVSLAPSSMTLTEERWRPKGVPSQLRSEAYLQDGKLCITIKGPSRALPALQLAASRPESVPLDVRIMLVQDNRRSTSSRKLPPLGAMKGARRPFTPPDRNVVENRAAWPGFNTRLDQSRRRGARRRLLNDSFNNSKDSIPSPYTEK